MEMWLDTCTYAYYNIYYSSILKFGLKRGEEIEKDLMLLELVASNKKTRYFLLIKSSNFFYQERNRILHINSEVVRPLQTVFLVPVANIRAASCSKHAMFLRS